MSGLRLPLIVWRSEVPPSREQASLPSVTLRQSETARHPKIGQPCGLRFTPSGYFARCLQERRLLHEQPTSSLEFLKCLNGILQYKLAEGLSQATVFNFTRDLKLWLEHMGQDIGKITSANLLEFLNYLRSENVARRISGREERRLSDKTIYNF